jgi:hypothetical protein
MSVGGAVCVCVCVCVCGWGDVSKCVCARASACMLCTCVHEFTNSVSLANVRSISAENLRPSSLRTLSAILSRTGSSISSTGFEEPPPAQDRQGASLPLDALGEHPDRKVPKQVTVAARPGPPRQLRFTLRCKLVRFAAARSEERSKDGVSGAVEGLLHFAARHEDYKSSQALRRSARVAVDVGSQVLG